MTNRNFSHINLNINNYIVQKNEIIYNTQSLHLYEAKLIRILIMQILKDDTEFKMYKIRVSEFAKILNINTSNLYSKMNIIAQNLTNSTIYINNKQCKWVDYCEYDYSTRSIYTIISNDLKPYLININKNYTKYYFEDISNVRSIYAIRIFELIQAEIKLKMIPKEGVNVKILVNTIRKACNCENKYSHFGMFRKKVIDTAIKEIERVSFYCIKYNYIKDYKKVIGFRFNVNMEYH